MKLSFSLFPLLIVLNSVCAQKPVINTGTFKKWASVEAGIISPDGNYACYTIYNQPVGSYTLVVCSTNNGWKKEYVGVPSANFSSDSKWIIFKMGRDTLCLQTVGKENIIFIPYVTAYKLTNVDKNIWLTYELNKPKKELVLRNLITGNEQLFSSIMNYQFSENTNNLLLEKSITQDTVTTTSLQLLSLLDGNIKSIWSGKSTEKTSNYTFDSSGKQLAFLLEKKDNDQLTNELWYFKKGMDTATKLVCNKDPQLEKGLVLASTLPEFSKGGNQIFFGLKAISENQNAKPGSVQVDVWSYRDPTLQSLQLASLKNESIYKAVVSITEKRVTRLEQNNEEIVAHNDDWALVMHKLGNEGQFESSWNLAAQFSFYLVSVKNTFRKLLKNHILNYDGGLALSPEGRWVLYYDFKSKNYFSYEIATGITRNITNKSIISWIEDDDDHPEPTLRWGVGRKTWLANDEAILIYDSYDIWQIDPTGIKLPINLTNGYGRKHHIKFELLDEGNSMQDFSIEKQSVLLLKAYNKINKDWGFYSKKLGKAGDPEMRSMGPYVFGYWGGYDTYNYPPLKAQKANCYITIKMSAIDAPNYFITSDFKRFTKISNIQPQKEYNWMSTELVHWQTLDGSISTGILYKPENFDFNKKYPLILDYYEKRSDELNLFIRPIAAEDRINIAWFVSNGYLVFTPDIHYKIGAPGQSAYNAVVSAANYLAKKSWVDPKRIGIQGHSWGGYETDYIITHTGIFAAACSASGICDLISWYGSSERGGYGMYHTERNQGRMGTTPWKNPDLYVKNSPIFKADKITTPLLMMNNKNDNVVSFAQGVEFFTALRRLGKKVWMLQYDGGRHSLGGTRAEDYSIRMTQFFDHYLKGACAPKWMTRGIPAKLKGIDDGIDLDNKIRTPEPGLDIKLEDIK